MTFAEIALPGSGISEKTETKIRARGSSLTVPFWSKISSQWKSIRSEPKAIAINIARKEMEDLIVRLSY